MYILVYTSVFPIIHWATYIMSSGETRRTQWAVETAEYHKKEKEIS